MLSNEKKIKRVLSKACLGYERLNEYVCEERVVDEWEALVNDRGCVYRSKRKGECDEDGRV